MKKRFLVIVIPHLRVTRSLVTRSVGGVRGIRFSAAAAREEDDWHRPIQGECNSGPRGGVSPLWSYDLTKTSAIVPRQEDWDLIIDVRSPSEFAEDHICGAINLPVLSDIERHEVGSLYAESPFEARKLGSSLVATNLGKALASDSFRQLPRETRLLVYCWRGGERSHSAAHIFSRIGWHAARLEGGYKAYRAAVQKALYQGQAVAGLRFALLQGPTGSFKSAILERIQQAGHQVLDLEALAGHRGSTLGSLFSKEENNTSMPTVIPQPSQKAFESRLLMQLVHMEKERVIFVESESARIGRIQLPRALHSRVIAAEAGFFDLHVPLQLRVHHLRQVYAVFETPAGAEDLKRRLQRLAPRRGHAAVQRWIDLIDRELWSNLVADLLENHYDAAYADAMRRDLRSISSNHNFTSQNRHTIHLDSSAADLDNTLAGAAEQIIEQAQIDTSHSCDQQTPLSRSTYPHDDKKKQKRPLPTTSPSNSLPSSLLSSASVSLL